MMKRVIVLVVALVVVLSACTKSDIRLQGYVGCTVNKDVFLTQDVTVSIKKNKKSYETKTDVVGFYMIEKLTAGTWEITVSKEGYVSQTKKIAVSGGSSGNIFREDFILVKPPKK